jgi:hypothetical protein
MKTSLKSLSNEIKLVIFLRNMIIITYLTIVTLLGSSELSAEQISNLKEAKPVYIKILKFCGATQTRIYEDFDILIIETKGVDLSCFNKKLSLHVSAKGNSSGKFIENKIATGILDNSQAKIITYLSLFAERGGEVRFPSQENIILDKTFFYFILGDRLGISTRLIKKNIFHIVVDGSNYDQNYLFNNKDNSLINLGSGKIEFEQNKITKYWVKGYLTENGGAFWFNVKLDYQGRYIELFNVKKFSECYIYNKFGNMSDEFQVIFKKQKLKKLCVHHN